MDNANTLSSLVTANLQILTAIGILTDEVATIKRSVQTIPSTLQPELNDLKELSMGTADAILAIDTRVGDELKATLKSELAKGLPKDHSEALGQLVKSLMLMQEDLRNHTSAVNGFSSRISILEQKVADVTDVLIDTTARLNTLDLRLTKSGPTGGQVSDTMVGELNDAMESLKNKLGIN